MIDLEMLNKFIDEEIKKPLLDKINTEAEIMMEEFELNILNQFLNKEVTKDAE